MCFTTSLDTDLLIHEPLSSRESPMTRKSGEERNIITKGHLLMASQVMKRKVVDTMGDTLEAISHSRGRAALCSLLQSSPRDRTQPGPRPLQPASCSPLLQPHTQMGSSLSIVLRNWIRFVKSVFEFLKLTSKKDLMYNFEHVFYFPPKQTEGWIMPKLLWFFRVMA